MNLKFFKLDGNQYDYTICTWRSTDDERCAEEWWIVVTRDGITINRGSEDHGGSWEDKNLPDVLLEAVALYQALQNDPTH